MSSGGWAKQDRYTCVGIVCLSNKWTIDIKESTKTEPADINLDKLKD